MRSFVEMTVDEEDAVDELDLPLSQQETKTSTRRADAMFPLMKQQERRLSRGEETILASPVRPTKRRHHRDSFNKHEVDESGATMVVLTPVKATPNQQRKHKCEMILTPVRKSIRLMKQEKEDIITDKLIDTTYAYANNEFIQDKTIDASCVCSETRSKSTFLINTWFQGRNRSRFLSIDSSNLLEEE